LYSKGPRFKTQPKGHLYWARYIVVLLNPSRKMLRYYFKLDHDRVFLSFRRYILTASLNKTQIRVP
jgi:hypothetical protein